MLVPPRLDHPRRTPRILSTILVTIALSFGVLSAPAAAGDRVDLTVHGGYRSGILDFDFNIACITSLLFGPCPHGASGEDDATFGVTVDVPVARQWMIEVRLDHQATFVRLSEPLLQPVDPLLDVPPDSFGPLTISSRGGDLDVTSLYVGALRWWRIGGVEPFVSLSVGVASIDLGPVFAEPNDLLDEHLTAALGAGLKLRPDARLGARFELRGIWVDLPAPDDLFGVSLGGDTAIELDVGAVIRF